MKILYYGKQRYETNKIYEVLYLIFMAVSGVAMLFFNTPATVLLQEKTEADYLGRVFGVLSMIASIMMPISMLVFGPIADLIKIEYMLVGTGILLLVEGFLLIRSKEILKEGI